MFFVIYFFRRDPRVGDRPTQSAMPRSFQTTRRAYGGSCAAGRLGRLLELAATAERRRRADAAKETADAAKETVHKAFARTQPALSGLDLSVALQQLLAASGPLEWDDLIHRLDAAGFRWTFAPTAFKKMNNVTSRLSRGVRDGTFCRVGLRTYGLRVSGC